MSRVLTSIQECLRRRHIYFPPRIIDRPTIIGFFKFIILKYIDITSMRDDRCKPIIVKYQEDIHEYSEFCDLSNFSNFEQDFAEAFPEKAIPNYHDFYNSVKEELFKFDLEYLSGNPEYRQFRAKTYTMKHGYPLCGIAVETFGVYLMTKKQSDEDF